MSSNLDPKSYEDSPQGNPIKKRRTNNTNSPPPATSSSSAAPWPTSPSSQGGMQPAKQSHQRGNQRPILPKLPSLMGGREVSSMGVFSQDDARRQVESPFFHGPTNLPPQTYEAQTSNSSKPKSSKSATSRLSNADLLKLPMLEDRVSRLEKAVDGYVEQRGKRAVERATLSELDSQDSNSGSGN